VSRLYWSLLTLIFVSSCREKSAIIIPDYFPQSNRIFFDSVSQSSIDLGEKLFFDKRLSYNDSISCSTCHDPNLAFTDGKKISLGVYNRFSTHNSSTLFSVGFSPTFMFDMRAHNLDAQTTIPIQDSNEMQMNIFDLEKKLSGDKEYQAMAKKAYGTNLTIHAYTRALAAYMKSLISCTTRYDSFLITNDSLKYLSPSERGGMSIFFGKGNCNHCHTAPLFSNYQHYNISLEKGKDGKIGLMRMTHKEVDRGRYKTPTLRNIALTAPYFHDGRAIMLAECVDFHIDSARKTMDYSPPNLSKVEKQNLISFLLILTDDKYKNSASLQK
jgi:cytochrome c peroxidase